MVVKGQNHFNCDHKDYDAKIDLVKNTDKYPPHKFSFQKVLEKKNNRELNVFIVRDLDTREKHFFSVYITTKMKNINRKLDEVVFLEVVDPQKNLGNKYKGFCDYMDDIKFDYGRVELIEDKILGWCVIDINNSPGEGILTEKYHINVVDMFREVISH